MGTSSRPTAPDASDPSPSNIQHRRALALLRESQQRFRDVADLAGDFIWETGPDFRLTYLSERFGQLTGLDIRHLLGKTPLQIADGDTRSPAWQRHLKNVNAHRPFRDFIYALRNQDRCWHLRMNGKPLFDARGRFAGYRGTGTDISAEVEARAEAEREAKTLALVFDSIAEGMIIVAPDLTVVSFNRRILEMAGMPPGHVRIGDKYEDILRYRATHGTYGPGDVEQQVRERMAYLIEGRPRLFERISPDGHVLEIRGTPLPGGGYVTTYVDITERRRAELALKHSEQRFRDIAEVAGDWIWEAGPDLRLTYLSEGYEAITGIDPASVLGRTRMESAGAELNDPSWQQHLADIEARRAFRNFCYRFRDKATGRMRYVRINGKPVFDAAGRFQGYRGVGRDVTEEKRIEAKLLEAKESAELANRTKGQFLANVSHELRTPLNAIIGFSEMLYQELFGPVGSPKYKQYAKDIYDSGRHLLNIINEILDLSKAESGKIELNEERVDLGDVIDDAIRLVGGRAEEVGVALASHSQEPIKLLADRRRLKQILLNLLSNAVKFTPSGGRIDLQAKLVDGALAIRVADTGIGMEPDDIPKALQPFTQIDSALNRKYEGTGLGLPLTNALVQMHGGMLEVESAPGAGTTVVVTMPAERVLDAADGR